MSSKLFATSLFLLPMLTASGEGAFAASSPVVLELFTSQSCSSCPPADALLKTLTEEDPSLLALSYHVNYWDYLSWKDTYSLPESTDRQRNYASVLGQGVFTPELIVDGTYPMVGSNEKDVTHAIQLAKQHPLPINITLTPEGGQLAINATAIGTMPTAGDILEVRFDRYAKTSVEAGENGGHTLESINNVTQITKLGQWTGGITTPLSIKEPNTGSGVAVLIQAPGYNQLLGAAVALK